MGFFLFGQGSRMVRLSDLHFAARMLRRRPGSTAITLLVLALGIGLVSAVFSIADGMLWRPLDFAGSSRVVSLVEEGNQYPPWVPFDDFRHLEERQTVLEGLIAYNTFYNLVTPEVGSSWGSVGSYVTSSFFDLLPVTPRLGRRFLPGDDEPGAEPVAIVSHRVWLNRLGGDPDVLGTALLVNERPTTLVGVMPEGVHFPYRHDLWLSLPHGEAAKGWWLMIAGRLRPGVSLRQAQTELAFLGAELDSARPQQSGEAREWSFARYMSSTISKAYQDSVRLLLVAVLGVLLVACLNVANIRLVQAVERSGELSIRRALGAKPQRLLGLLLAETSLLVAGGTLAGLVLAHGVVALYRAYLLPSVAMQAYWIDARLDWRALGVAAAAAAFAALGGGLLPALATALRQVGWGSPAKVGAIAVGGPRRLLVRRGLVVTQMALATALLIASGLMMRSVWNLQGVDPGMQSSRVLIGRLQLYHLGVDGEDPVPARQAFLDRLLQALHEKLGIETAAVGSGIPGGWRSGSVPFAVSAVEREAEEPPKARFVFVSPGYFDTLGTPILSGRPFGELDGGTRRVVIVDGALAQLHFPGRTPVGDRLEIRTAEGWVETTVVGVVAEALTSALDRGRPTIFAPLPRGTSDAGSAPFVLIKGRREVRSLAPLLEETVARTDPRVSVHEILPLDTLISRQTWTQRTLRALLLGFGSITLLMAAAGLYAVLAFTVERRTHELGIRAALGAGRADLRRLVLFEGMMQVGVGLILGTALATVGMRFLGAFLFGVERADGAVHLAALAVLALTGLLASLRPASRAARIAPAEALRYE